MEDVKYFDATDELIVQHVRMNKDQSNIDWLRVKSGYILHISSHFDVLERWKTVGVIKCPAVLVTDLPKLLYLLLMHFRNESSALALGTKIPLINV